MSRRRRPQDASPVTSHLEVLLYRASKFTIKYRRRIEGRFYRRRRLDPSSSASPSLSLCDIILRTTRTPVHRLCVNPYKSRST